MKAKNRWLKAILEESVKPGVDLPWTGKRNSFARLASPAPALQARRLRIPLTLLRHPRG
ncbi:MAG: hypothetical protein RLZZ528_1281 [Pseudomonadota bacterium]